MREIKFRGKSLDNGEWLYGYLMPSTKPHIHLNAKYSISVCTEILHSIDRYIYEVETNTIGQFTGLKDKNGKEIYEGDIVKVPYIHPIFCNYMANYYDTAIITFLSGSFVVTYKGGEKNIYISELYEQLEIIGNIFDNKDLLQ